MFLLAQSEHTCEYLYSVEQSRFTGNAEDSITVTANIQVSCESSELLVELVVTHIAGSASDTLGAINNYYRWYVWFYHGNSLLYDH